MIPFVQSVVKSTISCSILLKRQTIFGHLSLINGHQNRLAILSDEALFHDKSLHLPNSKSAGPVDENVEKKHPNIKLIDGLIFHAY